LFLHSRTVLTGQFLPGMGGKLAPFNLIFHNETDWAYCNSLRGLLNDSKTAAAAQS
jgi:hypothetical protein